MSIETSSIRRISAFLFFVLFSSVGQAWEVDKIPLEIQRKCMSGGFNYDPEFELDPCSHYNNAVAEDQKQKELYESENARLAQRAKDAEARAAETKKTATSATSTSGIGSAGAVPVPEARPTPTSAQAAQASQCQAQATAAVSACTEVVNMIQSSQSKVTTVAEQMGQASNTANACRSLSQTASSEISTLNSKKAACNSAANKCATTCSSAVSSMSGMSGSSEYTAATDGNHRCSSATSNLGRVDSAIAMISSAKNQGDQCVAQITGTSGTGNTASNDSGQANNQGTTTTTTSSSSPSSEAAMTDVLSSGSTVDNLNLNSSYQSTSYGSTDSPYGNTSSAVSRQTQTSKSNSVSNPVDTPNSAKLTERQRQALAYEASKKKAVEQQQNNLKQLNASGLSANGRDPIEIKNDSTRSKASTDIYGGNFGGGQGGGRGYAKGGYPDAPQGARGGKLGNMANAAANDARNQASYVNLERFLPGENRMVGPGGRRTPADVGSEIAGPHTNMFRSVTTRFETLAATLIVPTK